MLSLFVAAYPVVKVAQGHKLRKFFCAVLEHFVEAYWLVALSLHTLHSRVLSEKEFVKSALELGDHLFVEREILLQESISREIITNALQYFAKQGVIIITNTDDRKSPLIKLAPAWQERAKLDKLVSEIKKLLLR